MWDTNNETGDPALEREDLMTSCEESDESTVAIAYKVPCPKCGEQCAICGNDGMRYCGSCKFLFDRLN